jgi:hypothetical protein
MSPPPCSAGSGAWTDYLLRERQHFALPPPGVNVNYAEERGQFVSSSKL